jgi:hypothetical protein
MKICLLAVKVTLEFMVEFFWQKTSLENFKICLQIWQLIVKRYPLTMQKSIESCPLKEAWQKLYMNMNILMSRSISTCLSPCPCTCSCLCSCSCVIFAISVSCQLSGHGHGTGHKHLCVKLIVEN